jgi:hypothetical protein
MAEWTIAFDCKSNARKGYVGSNPAPSTLQSKTFALCFCFAKNFVLLLHTSLVTFLLEEMLRKNDPVIKGPVLFLEDSRWVSCHPSNSQDELRLPKL